MSFSRQYLSEAHQILGQLDVDAIDQIVKLLVETRSGGGRLFILGWAERSQRITRRE
jgi:hypothetical protein